jgi:ferredoxin/flavodoxin
MEIYFFSGTGNTLFLVKELKKRIPETVLISIAALRDCKEIIPKSKKIGFCFPNHGGQIPVAMKMFIKKLKLKGDEYLFALVSSGGTGCNAFSTIDKIIKKKGQQLNGKFLINVPSFNPKTDDLTSFPTSTELEAFKNSVPEKLDSISVAINQTINLTKLDAPPYQLPWFIENILAPLVLNIFENYPSLLKDYFYVDSKCTGCGVCEQVCPTGRIKVEEKPVWNSKIQCYTCHACLAFCSVGAIQVKPKIIWAGSKTLENPRFKPQYAKVSDIAKQRTEKEYEE